MSASCTTPTRRGRTPLGRPLDAHWAPGWAPTGAGHRSPWEDGGVLRWITAGESHGPALVAVLEGLPAGVPVTSADIATQLARRRLGYGRGAQDEVRAGRRRASWAGSGTGSPWAVRWPCRSATPSGRSGRRSWPPTRWPDGTLDGLARNAPLTRPRPGHADLAGMQKYGFDDARPVLERASARETAARVALGTVAQHYLRAVLGAEVVSHVVSHRRGGRRRRPAAHPGGPGRHRRVAGARAAPGLHRRDGRARSTRPRPDGDTLGGVVEVLVYGLPPGLGSFVQGDRRLDARLAGALMGIQAIKGVGVGDGFATARRRGQRRARRDRPGRTPA